MKCLLSQIRIFFTNRIGIISVFTNLILAVWGLSEKGWEYGIFHFYYEPLPIKILSLVNLPVLFLAGSISRTLFPKPPSHFGFVITDDFEMSLIVLFSIFQWLLSGYIMTTVLGFTKEKVK